MKRNSTPTDNIKYSEICKAIQRKIKEDIRKHVQKQICYDMEYITFADAVSNMCTL